MVCSVVVPCKSADSAHVLTNPLRLQSFITGSTMSLSEFSGIPSMLQTKTSLCSAVLVSSPWNILQLMQMTDTSTSRMNHLQVPGRMLPASKQYRFCLRLHKKISYDDFDPSQHISQKAPQNLVIQMLLCV